MARRYRKIYHRQRPIAGGREQLPSCVLKEIYEWVESEARKYGVGRSFVVATAVAKVAGIGLQEDYKTLKPLDKNFK